MNNELHYKKLFFGNRWGGNFFLALNHEVIFQNMLRYSPGIRFVGSCGQCLTVMSLLWVIILNNYVLRLLIFIDQSNSLQFIWDIKCEHHHITLMIKACEEDNQNVNGQQIVILTFLWELYWKFLWRGKQKKPFYYSKNHYFLSFQK